MRFVLCSKRIADYGKLGTTEGRCLVKIYVVNFETSSTLFTKSVPIILIASCRFFRQEIRRVYSHDFYEPKRKVLKILALTLSQRDGPGRISLMVF